MEEEGRISEAWQSPIQRRLASDFDESVHAPASKTKKLDRAGRLRGAIPGEQTHDGDARGPSGASDDGQETLHGDMRLLGGQASRRGLESAKYAEKTEVESDRPVRGLQLPTYFEGGDGDWAHDRGLRSQGAEKGRDKSCPLIYAVDAVTAKKYGLHLFQVRRVYDNIDFVS